MKSKAIITYLIFLLIGVSFQTLLAQEPRHPSLFFTVDEIPEIKKNIEKSAWMSKAYEVLIKQANEMMQFGPEPYAYSNSIDPNYARGSKEDWKKSGIMGRIIEKRVGTLAITGYLSGNQLYIDKAIDIMVAAAETSDPEEWYGHLQHGDGARGYAIGYDLLYPYMNEKERQLIRSEIVKVGTLLDHYKGIWSKSHPVINSQNHVAIHYGGLGLCALILGDKPEWQAKAINRIRAYISHFIDGTGYCTEGVDYTNYGLLGVVPYAVALQNSTGIDLIGEQANMHLVPNQMIWKMMPWGKELIAMNDNPTTMGSSAGLIYIMSRYQHSEGLWAWLQIEGENGTGLYGAGMTGRRGDHRPSIGDGLSLPFVLLWGNSKLEPSIPTGLSHFFSSGRVFMRDSWENPLGSHVSFTSGIDYHQGHNHADENAFTFNAFGEEFAIDPGRFPLGTESHNTILVNGRGQILQYGKGNILDYREMGSAVYVKGDARHAYAVAPHFTHKRIEVDTSDHMVFSKAQRQLLYVRGAQPYLIIVDDYQTEDSAINEYAWLVHTDTSNNFKILKEEKAAQIIGSKRGAICDVNFLWPNDNLKIEKTNLENARVPTTRKLGGNDNALWSHYKELNAKTNAVNPHFVTMLLARENDSKKPIITTKGNAKKLEVFIEFSDGTRDSIQISSEFIEFYRNHP